MIVGDEAGSLMVPINQASIRVCDIVELRHLACILVPVLCFCTPLLFLPYVLSHMLFSCALVNTSMGFCVSSFVLGSIADFITFFQLQITTFFLFKFIILI